MLSAYSYRDLQMFGQLLSAADQALSVGQLFDEVSACPGRLTKCPAINGEIILRCHACGYSELR